MSTRRPDDDDDAGFSDAFRALTESPPEETETSDERTDVTEIPQPKSPSPASSSAPSSSSAGSSSPAPARTTRAMTPPTGTPPTATATADRQPPTANANRPRIATPPAIPATPARPRLATPPAIPATPPSRPRIATPPPLARAASEPAYIESKPPVEPTPRAASEPPTTKSASELATSKPPSGPTSSRAPSEPRPTDDAPPPSEPTRPKPRLVTQPPTDRRTGPNAPLERPSPLPRGVSASDATRESGSQLPPTTVAAAEASTTQTPSVGMRLLEALPWLLISLPALYQLGLLSTAIAGRIGYPYDLEWMEGGMLHHAQRIYAGQGIYVPPSIQFIPYLYTPLYPSLLALFGSAFGITYQLGRMFSVLGLIGIALVGGSQLASKRHQHARYAPPVSGTLLGLGLFAAAYPYMEGWYDLVRADTFFLFLVTGGIAGLARWAKSGTGLHGHAKVAAGGVILALAFFAKQTGIVYVALGGLIVLVLNWRRVPAYVATAGVLGLGGTWLLQQTTDGWFWIYIREIHAAHDFNMDRFWKSFENILWHFPAMTVVVVVGLVVVAVTRIVKGPLPRAVHPLFLWTTTFAVSTLIGAVGWGTEFAHFNAYMPAFLHGGLAAGAAVVAIYACARVWWGERTYVAVFAAVIGLGAASPLAWTCWKHRWNPRAFVPTARDVAAGDKLIARIAAIEGDVWMPSHPWYLHLAGKEPRVHRMGVRDVTWRKPRPVEGVAEALSNHGFEALVLDERDIHTSELPAVKAYYRAALKLPADERPRLYTGAKIVPDSIWVPAVTAKPPAGARVLFDFEQPTWDPWKVSGAAWGPRPATEPLPGQGLVLGSSGRQFATSTSPGTGRVTSPPFELDGKVRLALGGGTDATKLRVELWVDGKIVATASAPAPGGSTLREGILDPGEARGRSATLVLVDDSPTDHLIVDDVWIVP